MKLFATIASTLPAVLASPVISQQAGACALASAKPQWTVSNFTYVTNIVFWTPLFGSPVTYHQITFDITNLAAQETRSCDVVDNTMAGPPLLGPNYSLPCRVQGNAIGMSIEGETTFFKIDTINNWMFEIDQSWECDGQKFRAQGTANLSDFSPPMPNGQLPNCDGSLDPTWGLAKQCLAGPISISGALVVE